MKAYRPILQRARGGFTLVELVFAIALSLLLGGVLLTLTEASLRLYAKTVSLNFCEWTARKVLNKVRPDIEKSTDVFDDDPVRLLDENGALLASGTAAYGGLGIRLTQADEANPNLRKYVAYLVVNGEELRYYPDASLLPNGTFQVLSDNLVAPTTVTGSGSQPQDFPFHFTSTPPPAPRLVDLNIRIRSRAYDRFLSRTDPRADAENPNTFFQVRTIAAPK